jgi:hypothetical protein
MSRKKPRISNAVKSRQSANTFSNLNNGYSRADKKKIKQSANYICQCCGKTNQELVLEGVDLTVHHIKFQKYGGKSTFQNAFVCCRDCHNKMHEFFDGLGFIVDFVEALKQFLLTIPTTNVVSLKRFNITKQHKKLHSNNIKTHTQTEEKAA